MCEFTGRRWQGCPLESRSYPFELGAVGRREIVTPGLDSLEPCSKWDNRTIGKSGTEIVNCPLVRRVSVQRGLVTSDYPNAPRCDEPRRSLVAEPRTRVARKEEAIWAPVGEDVEQRFGFCLKAVCTITEAESGCVRGIVSNNLS